MKKAILATKIGMTQIFNENGVLTPVTVLQAGPCFVTQVKTVEKTEFDVELTEVGPNKVKVIKVVREITGLGLKEAKDAVDGAPKVIKEQADKASAEDAKAKLEAEGAKVTLK